MATAAAPKKAGCSPMPPTDPAKQCRDRQGRPMTALETMEAMAAAKIPSECVGKNKSCAAPVIKKLAGIGPDGRCTSDSVDCFGDFVVFKAEYSRLCGMGKSGESRALSGSVIARASTDGARGEARPGERARVVSSDPENPISHLGSNLGIAGFLQQELSNNTKQRPFTGEFTVTFKLRFEITTIKEDSRQVSRVASVIVTDYDMGPFFWWVNDQGVFGVDEGATRKFVEDLGRKLARFAGKEVAENSKTGDYTIHVEFNKKLEDDDE